MGVLAEVKQTHGCGSKRKQESEIERGIPASTAYVSIPPLPLMYSIFHMAS